MQDLCPHCERETKTMYTGFPDYRKIVYCPQCHATISDVTTVGLFTVPHDYTLPPLDVDTDFKQESE